MSSRWRVCFTSGDRLLWAAAGPNLGGAILSAAITIERSTRISIRVTALNAMCSMNHLMWARIWLQNRKHRVMSSGSLEVMHMLSCDIHVICTLKKCIIQDMAFCKLVWYCSGFMVMIFQKFYAWHPSSKLASCSWNAWLSNLNRITDKTQNHSS